MSTRKSSCARLAVLGCAGFFCLGASYTWTPGGSNFYWDDYDNWTGTASSYPNTTNDDAIIPEDGREWGLSCNQSSKFCVLLITEQIDDLSINEDTSFTKKSGTSGTQTLTCDSVDIFGDGADVRVRVGGGDAALGTQ